MGRADETSQKRNGSRADEAAARFSPAAVRTFLIADVRGYTRFTHEHGDEEAGRIAAQFAQLARSVVSSGGGDLIELRGDEALCVFNSARQAVRTAAELQTAFRKRDGDASVFPLPIGIGLDAGEATPVEGGYRGGALNTAARLCSVAGPGQILATDPSPVSRAAWTGSATSSASPCGSRVSRSPCGSSRSSPKRRFRPRPWLRRSRGARTARG